jgi:hypothetical protein
MTTILARALRLWIVLLLCAVSTLAQSFTSNISARAEDTTGGVIPGVEVSISSPAMIGGTRSEVTDETGAYRFTLLPPGTYRVTFALPGFKTLNIEDVRVTAGNTATVVGKLEVASTVEEITVSSQAPTIDLESATVGVNISQKLMDDLPWSRSLQGLSMMIPGVYSTAFDIGNSNFGTSSAISAQSGGRSGGNAVIADGLVWCQTYSDYGSYAEMNVTTNAKGADQMNAGITVAMVVKSGSNQFHGNVTAKYQNGSMQSNNITPLLLAQGYGVGSNKTTHFTDYYGDIGGPVKKDKLWFYAGMRWGYQGTFIPGFRTAVGGDLTDYYTVLKDPSLKLTYQMSQTQKLEAYAGVSSKIQPYRSGTKKQPKEATQNQRSPISSGPIFTYTNIINPRTTLTAKLARGGFWWPGYAYGFNGPGFDGLGPQIAQLVNGSLVTRRIPTVTFFDVENVGVHISDTTSGAVDGAFNSNYQRPIRWQETADLSRFATIYGKNHELKVGYMGWWDKDYNSNFGYPYEQAYVYQSTATELCPNDEICNNWFLHPYRVTFYDYPNRTSNGAKYRAAYGNDKITWNKKLTLNVGLRWDWATSFLPGQGNTGEGPFSQKFVIPQTQNFVVNPAYDGKGYGLTNITGPGDKAIFPVYKLFSPRLSFAYDVFGNGKVAIKGSFGRYFGISASNNSQPGPGENSSGVNPISTTSCTYNNWRGDIPASSANYFGPDGIMGTGDDVGLSASCAKTAVVGGQVLPIATYHFDENLKPTYVNEFTAGLEVGINRDYSVRFAVQRKFDRNGSKTINVLKPSSKYTDLRCAIDPGRDAKPHTPDDNPAGPVCYYSIPSTDPAFSVTNQVFQATDAKTHESNSSYTGYTLTFNKNYSKRWQFVGAYDIDMSHNVNSNPDTPNAVLSNARSAPIVWNQSLKMSGVYGLPDIPMLFGFKLAGVQYSSSFISQNGTWYGRSAQVRDANGTTQTLVMEAHAGRYPWLNNWDQSVRKRFKLGETNKSLEFVWELYNSMNASTVRSWSTTTVNSSSYLQPDGITPLRPSTILVPRIYEWGVTFKF